jgi:large subunit ribosomal protein L32e
MKKKRPKFLHQEHWKLKRFRKASWRKPRGKRSKMRAKERAKPFLVTIGYRGPKKVRGWHPRGAPEITVFNVRDVERIEQETPSAQVVRIASGVGTRKKIEIVKKAVEKSLYVANPAIEFAKISSVEQLDSFLPVKPYIRKWYISGKVPDEERDDIEERAEEAGIEVVE